MSSRGEGLVHTTAVSLCRDIGRCGPEHHSIADAANASAIE
ncbi:hypothetical protein [Nocardia fluminea]